MDINEARAALPHLWEASEKASAAFRSEINRWYEDLPAPVQLAHDKARQAYQVWREVADKVETYCSKEHIIK